jgi:hypothetical protein
MLSSQIRNPRLKAILHLTVGVGISLISVPAAMAVSSAIATASLSFNVSSPNGTIGFSGFNLNGTADLTAASPLTTAGYSNATANASLSGSDSIGVNTINTSSSVSGRAFTSTSGVSIALPPFTSSSGSASSFNFVNIDTLNIVPVDGMFDLKFSSVHARLDLSLGNDAEGVAAFGGASWFVGVRYSMPGDVDGGTNTWSLSRSIGTDSSYSDTNNYYNSFTFSSIPASASNIQLYWETTAEARAVDGQPSQAPASVPDGGTSLLLFGTGLGAIGWMRRKLRSSESPATA